MFEEGQGGRDSHGNGDSGAKRSEGGREGQRYSRESSGGGERKARPYRPGDKSSSFRGKTTGGRPGSSAGRSSYGSRDGKPDGERRSSYGSREGRPDGERRSSYGSREGRPDGERRSSFGSREGRPDGERRSSYGSREGRPDGERRSSYGSREGRPDGERRSSYGSREGRPDGERRSSFASREGRPDGERRSSYGNREGRPDGERRSSFSSREGRPDGERRSSFGSREGRPDGERRSSYGSREGRPDGERRSSYGSREGRPDGERRSSYGSREGRPDGEHRPHFDHEQKSGEETSPRTAAKFAPEGALVRHFELPDDLPIPEDQLEGRNPVQEAVKAGRPVHKAWILKDCDSRLLALAAELKEKGVLIHRVERSTLDRLSAGRNHQGIVAQVAAATYADPEAVLDQLDSENKSGFLILLDEIQDPHNLGSILRVADACGADLVVSPERRSASLDAVTARTSAGAAEHVPFARVVNLGYFIDGLKKRGYWIFGTDAEGTSTYDAADYKDKIAILVGSEGEGISQKLRERCDFLLSIPMQGKVNSLNASVACGIVCFEAAKQRRLK